MNIFDKFLNNISYKFPKGYPDMSNPNDVSLLESLINETQSVRLDIKDNGYIMHFEFSISAVKAC